MSKIKAFLKIEENGPNGQYADNLRVICEHLMLKPTQAILWCIVYVSAKIRQGEINNE